MYSYLPLSVTFLELLNLRIPSIHLCLHNVYISSSSTKPLLRTNCADWYHVSKVA